MKIQINTDHNIKGREELLAEFEAVITKALSHFSAHITRVEVHLSDQNGDQRGQNDKRCLIEARFEGRRPTAVSCGAATLAQAVANAAEKLKSSLDSTLGQLHSHR